MFKLYKKISERSPEKRAESGWKYQLAKIIKFAPTVHIDLSNPAKVGKNERELLALLIKQHNIGVPEIEASKPYLIQSSHDSHKHSKKLQVSVSHPLIRRPSKCGWKYQVLDNKALGEGTFGEIKSSFWSLVPKSGNDTVEIQFSKQERVVKIMPNTSDIKDINNVAQEWSITDAMLGAKLPVCSENSAYFWMKRLPGKDLSYWLYEDEGHWDSIPIDAKLHIMQSILQQVNTLHSKGFIHRDLKPENIMLDYRGPNECVVNIIDFGLSTYKNQPDERVCGTHGYIAPEIFDEGGIASPASDIYALGVIFLEMLLPKQALLELGAQIINVPITSVSTLTQIYLNTIKQEQKSLPKQIYPLFLNFIKQMWDADPQKRPTISTLNTVFETTFQLSSPSKISPSCITDYK